MTDEKGACSTIGGRLCLQEVSNELDKLARIYDLFKEQKDFQVGVHTRELNLSTPRQSICVRPALQIVS
jgi:hypothetical protein